MARKNRQNVVEEQNMNANANEEQNMNANANEEQNMNVNANEEQAMNANANNEMFNNAMEILRACTSLSNDNIRELRAFVKTLKLEKAEDGGRKAELLALLEREERMGIKQIADAMGVSAKNVSSLLLYLKKEGHRICTDCEGRKFIER